MALLNILEFPDSRLRNKARLVEEVTAEIRQLATDMLETMYAAPGVGLSATQVNVHQRVVVIDVSEERNDPRVFINPEVTVLDSETAENEEGCLSVPGYQELVERPLHVKVTALNENGESLEFTPDGLMAVCIQHEIDHLDGKLFVDYLSPLKRQRIQEAGKKSPPTGLITDDAQPTANYLRRYTAVRRALPHSPCGERT